MSINDPFELVKRNKSKCRVKLDDIEFAKFLENRLTIII